MFIMILSEQYTNAYELENLLLCACIVFLCDLLCLHLILQAVLFVLSWLSSTDGNVFHNSRQILPILMCCGRSLISDSLLLFH